MKLSFGANAGDSKLAHLRHQSLSLTHDDNSEPSPDDTTIRGTEKNSEPSKTPDLSKREHKVRQKKCCNQKDTMGHSYAKKMHSH